MFKVNIKDTRTKPVSYLVHNDTLLWNATVVITKCDNYFITESGKGLLQNVSSFLLQNVTGILQNVTVIIKWNFMTKKGRLLQDASAETSIKNI